MRTWTAQGYVLASDPTVGYLVGPVSIVNKDHVGRVTDQIQATYASTDITDLQTAIANFLTPDSKTGNPFAISSYVSWTANNYAHTHLVATAVYYSIDPTWATDRVGGTPAWLGDADHPTNLFVGSSGINYTVTTYGYESTYSGLGSLPGYMGRQNKTVAADGTITRVVYDSRGNVVETWMGTNDSGATDANPHPSTATGNNMVRVSGATYEPDGTLIQSRTYYGDASTDCYATDYYYDQRDRLTDTLTPAAVDTHYTYDNLGEVIETNTYANCSYNTSSKTIDGVTTSTNLRAKTTTSYDALGRAIESRRYEVDPATGAVGDYLPTYTWYDAADRVVKTQTGGSFTVDGNGVRTYFGAFTKSLYDSLGRLIEQYTGFDGQTGTAGETTADRYVNGQANIAASLSDDTIVQQTRYWYDAAGETVATATYQRLPNDADTGELDAAGSYVTVTKGWYDAIGRTTAQANYGRQDIVGRSIPSQFFDYPSGDLRDAVDANGTLGTDGVKDLLEGSVPDAYAYAADSSGDAYIVSKTAYDDAGRVSETIDNIGRVNKTLYDDAGRARITIQNYKVSDGNGTYLSSDILATDSDSAILGKLKETDRDVDIVTKYDYDSKGRLRAMVVFNAKGEDNNSVVNNIELQTTTYHYDDSATSINFSWQTGVVYPNDSTLDPDHTSTTYDRLGRKTDFTDQRGVIHTYSYGTTGSATGKVILDSAAIPTGSGVDDSVQSIGTAYDDVGRVQKITSYDDADPGEGTVVNQVKYVYDTWGNLAAEYQAHDGVVDANTPTSVQYVYEDGLAPGSTDSPAKYVRLSDTIYRGGRDVHYGYGTTDAIDDIMSRLATITDKTSASIQYKYLGLGTVVEEDNLQSQTKLTYLNSSGDNVTGFDRFGRIADHIWTDYGVNPDVTLDEYAYIYDRAGNRTAKTSSLNGSLNESYVYDDLDRLVEWKVNNVSQETWMLDSLGNDLSAGSYNKANEETPDEGSSGYDAAGNMTTLSSGYTAKYDAWNRLVKVTDGASTIQENEYDGTGRRIQIFTNFDGQTPGDVEDDYYAGQQVTVVHHSASGVFQGAEEYVWSPRYIDAPILRDSFDNSHSLITNSRVLYLADANYNVTGLVKYDAGTQQWKVAERYSYTPYGKVTYRNANWDAYTDPNPQSLFSNTCLYTGRTLDTLTSLYYYRARFYDAALGRFVNRDPIGYKGGINLYEYAKDSSIGRTDPNGLDDSSSKIQGEAEAGCGRFRINMYPNDRKTGMDGYVAFIPDGKCPLCKSIRIVQIGKGWDAKTGEDLAGKERQSWETQQDDKNGIEKGWFVDRLPSACKKEKNPTPCYGGNDPDAPVTPGCNNGPDSKRGTVIADHPHDPNKGANTTFLFEDCALCEDTGQYLGCATWGFSVIGGQIYPEQLKGASAPSNTFKEAVKRFKGNCKN